MTRNEYFLCSTLAGLLLQAYPSDREKNPLGFYVPFLSAPADAARTLARFGFAELKNDLGRFVEGQMLFDPDMEFREEMIDGKPYGETYVPPADVPLPPA